VSEIKIGVIDIYFLLEEMIKIETYEDCPCDEELLVWTGDSFAIEYVDMSADDGTYYPVNGTEFDRYIHLPDREAFMSLVDKED